MSNPRLDTLELRQRIAALMDEYPELAQDETLRADMLDGSTDIEAILRRLLFSAMEAKSMAFALKVRIDDLCARKARFDRQEEAFRSLIQSVLDQAQLPKYTLPEATLSISRRPPAPVITNEDALPHELCQWNRSPDMEKITAAVGNGGAMPPGVSMSNGKSVLTIRSR